MKKILIFLNLLIITHISYSQHDLNGNWQGVSDDKRFVFRFTNETSFLDTPDDGWMNIPISNLRKDSDSFSVQLPYISASYKGKFIDEKKLRELSTIKARNLSWILNEFQVFPESQNLYLNKNKVMIINR